jgi:CheY-like chemotaxis protein
MELLNGRKLLLADDSVTIQKVVNLTFADEGMEVIAVSDGEQAIKQLELIVPDIVLADIFMPGPDGYKICELIKNDERFKHIPVILLVGMFEPYNEEEARNIGADDVLTKPFESIRNLINKVTSLLGGKKNEPTVEALVGADLKEEVSEKKYPVNTIFGQPLATEPTPQYPTSSTQTPVDLDDEMIETRPAGQFSHERSTPSVKLVEVEESIATTPSIIETSQAPQLTKQSEKADLEASPAISPATLGQKAVVVKEVEGPLDLDPVEVIGLGSDDNILDLDDIPTIPTIKASKARPLPFTSKKHNTGEINSGDPLSEETVDIIARRVVEQLSNRAVQDVAWEVVPQLAELMIKRELDQWKQERSQ